MTKYKLTEGWRQNHKASGGLHFLNKELDKSIFINYFKNAGIMTIDSGRCDKIIGVRKNEIFASIVKRLTNKVKYKENK